MTPPTTATLTDEQKQQQKIMKIMMVVMFPVMLYAAPSGLTLYILTSSCMGIVEGRVIRKRIAYLDTLPKDEKKTKPSKTRDKLGRMYAEALERAQEKQRQKQRGGKAKRFKDRKAQGTLRVRTARRQRHSDRSRGAPETGRRLGRLRVRMISSPPWISPRNLAAGSSVSRTRLVAR
jgi:hypothetical protein